MKNVLVVALALQSLAVTAVPAVARSWKAPEGCEIFMTVQSKGCRVSNHYRCTGDAQGDQWRADFDQEGMFFRSRINFETEWVESYETDPAMRQVLEPNPTDAASFSELISSGMDTFDFALSRDNGERGLVSGFDRLTGASITIDGIRLEETEFEYRETDEFGNLRRAGRGKEYISRDLRMFFSGPSQTLWSLDDSGEEEWLPIDGSPLQFIKPGEKGFASSQPIFDCDALTAGAEGPFQIWKASLSTAAPFKQAP